MPVQRERFVLGEHNDLIEIGIEAVGEGKIDDSVNPPEGYGGFRTVASKRIKPLALSPREKEHERPLQIIAIHYLVLLARISCILFFSSSRFDDLVI